MTLFTLTLALSFAFSSAYPLVRRETCSSPTTRVDWLTLSETQKTAYFDAELCLMHSPAQLDIGDVVSRYDDLVRVHQLQADTNAGTDTWHFVGQFLHIHRFYVHTHETLLRQECNYTGPIPYWNEEVDANNYDRSVVVTDFGGFGESEETGFVITEGPFANLTLKIGPGSKSYDHQLSRYYNKRQSRNSGSWYVYGVRSQKDFATFKDLLYDTLHIAGHNGVGGGWGDMSNVLSSPNDPLFWMHHTYLDKIWAEWQGTDNARIHDLKDAGNESQSEPATGYVATHPGTVLHVYNIIPNATVADVASTTAGYLCYTYQ